MIHRTSRHPVNGFYILLLSPRAVQDMPDVEEITTLLSGAYITYFHCLRIVELLKVSEADTRNIFGRYSSQRMKV